MKSCRFSDLFALAEEVEMVGKPKNNSSVNVGKNSSHKGRTKSKVIDDSGGGGSDGEQVDTAPKLKKKKVQ